MVGLSEFGGFWFLRVPCFYARELGGQLTWPTPFASVTTTMNVTSHHLFMLHPLFLSLSFLLSPFPLSHTLYLSSFPHILSVQTNSCVPLFIWLPNFHKQLYNLVYLVFASMAFCGNLLFFCFPVPIPPYLPSIQSIFFNNLCTSHFF